MPGTYQAHQPRVIGDNGEVWLSFLNTLCIFARLWIDSELKAEMGY